MSDKNKELTEEELKKAAGGLTTYAGYPAGDPTKVPQQGSGYQG